MKTMTIQGENLEKVVALLRRTRLFHTLDEAELRRAAGEAQLLQLEAGEELTRQDDIPDALAVVLSGEVRFLTGAGDDAVELGRLGPGEVIGIAAILVARPSPAAGNQLLNDSLAALVGSGAVDPDEALAKAIDKADLARKLGRPLAAV